MNSKTGVLKNPWVFDEKYPGKFQNPGFMTLYRGSLVCLFLFLFSFLFLFVGWLVCLFVCLVFFVCLFVFVFVFVLFCFVLFCFVFLACLLVCLFLFAFILFLFSQNTNFYNSAVPLSLEAKTKTNKQESRRILSLAK